MSVLALGVMPWFNALIVGELAWLLIPAVRRWRSANGSAYERGVVILAVIFAAVQAYGVAVAFDQFNGLVLLPGDGFVWPAAITLFAASMLAMLMAQIITREGIGSGFWVLFLSQSLIGLPAAAGYLFAGIGTGAYSAGTLLVVPLLTIAAAVLVVTLLRQRTELGLKDHSAVVWPPLLGAVLAGWVFAFVSMRVVSEDGLSTYVQAGHVIYEAIIAGMIVLVAWRYGALAGFASLGLKTGVVLAGVAVVPDLVLPALGLPPLIGGSTLIIAVTVLFSFAQVWQTAGNPGMPPGEHNRPDTKTL
jgi:preprotein translocase subunit SecY